MSRPTNRTALREEANRSGAAQPGTQRQGGHRAHAVDLVHEHPGAVHVPGGGQQPPAQPVNMLVDGVHHRQGRC
jgi:hypothetical protein